MLRVSDHALVRFLERVGGLDVEAVRRHLQDSIGRAAQAARALDQTEFRVRAGGVTFVVENGVVVTIIGGRR